jgi:DnaJ-class molecular chaperone
MQLAKYLDQKGSFAAAARLYAQSGNGNAAAAHRHAELTAVQACDVCGGIGKTQTLTPCPVCVGKGTVMCGTCDGRGFSFIPGSPPCTTCGGSGGIVQDGRTASCSACGGTGKGKGSVIKQPCVQCSHGKSPCRECDGGWIKLIKECAACRGVGSRALADP